MRLNALIAFIIERHKIWKKRARGKPAPWTKDPILQTYRFCNVYRELDKVTLWIATHWRKPHADYPHLWFSMVVARLINNPDTLGSLALPGRWNKTQFLRVMHRRRDRGEKAFGSAYIVSTNGRKMDKAQYLAEQVLDPMWEEREGLQPKRGDTLSEYHATLGQYQGMGSFMAAQVVADLKYVEPLRSAADWWTFAASGPGSRRGLNRVMGLDPSDHWNEVEWYKTLRAIRGEVNDRLVTEGMDKLHAQDLQNCLCEFDKYERARLKEGRPKQKYVPQEE